MVDPLTTDSPQEVPGEEVPTPVEENEENEGSLPEEENVAPGDVPMQTEYVLDKLQGKVVRKSERKQTLTPKGRENSLKNSISFMKSCNKRMKKQVDIVLLLLNGNNVDSVNGEMNNIEKTYAEFTESYARSCSVFGEDETEDLTTLHTEISVLMDAMDFLYLECKEKVCGWLLEKEKQIADVAKTHSASGSSRSGSSKSSRSSRTGSKSRSGSSKNSKSTSRSGESHCSNLSLHQKAKVAGLKAEADAIQNMKEAELSAELSRLDVKIKKAEAMEKVYSSHVVKDGNRNNEVLKKSKVVSSGVAEDDNQKKHKDEVNLERKKVKLGRHNDRKKHR